MEERPSLTDSEQLVVALIARGLSTRQIAEELGVTAQTATHYVSRVLHFMKQRGRVETGGERKLTSR